MFWLRLGNRQKSLNISRKCSQASASIKGISMQHYENFVDGKFARSSGHDRIDVVNPSTGSVICTVPESTSADVDAAVSVAESAQSDWALRPAIERARVLRTLAQQIRQSA